MIEPELAGAALAREIRDARPADGSADVWRLGQSGMVVRLPSATVLLDAYLSNHCEAVLGPPFDHRRMTRSPLDPVDLDMVDLVVCSHDHLDHLDPPTVRTLARQNPTAVIAAPRVCTPVLQELGWSPDRILGCDDGTVVDVGGLRLESFAVPHDDFDAGPDGHPYLGWVVDDGRVRVAHLGDSRAHADVVAALAARPVDLLAVPINGRDDGRAAIGFAGNMSAAEAVSTALESGARTTLPMHYDMFAQNVDVGALETFVDEAAATGLRTAVLPVGRRLTVEETK